MSKQAFLVTGPESSGTRILTRVLMAAGCAGDGGDFQRFDGTPIAGGRIVWRRSVPHAGDPRPPLDAMARDLRNHGYEVKALVIVRDAIPNALSQIRNRHTNSTPLARRRIRDAMAWIWAALMSADVETYAVTYSALRDVSAIRTLLGELGLDAHAAFEPIRNEDGKYLEGAGAASR